MSLPGSVAGPGDGPLPAHDTPLAELTTMRVGGAAEQILVAHTTDVLVRLASELAAGDVPWLLLGGGSNTIVHDDGFPGVVLLVRTSGIERIEHPDGPHDAVRVRVQAGHDWDALVSTCVDRGWAGIEALSGIPGRVGAAPVQNIGAYGQELSDVLHSVEFLDEETGEVVRLGADDLELGYRDSALKRGRSGVVLSVDLLLSESGETGPVRYGQLADALGVEVGAAVAIRRIRESVLGLRASKGMVLDEADHDTWSAGSFFTNPIVSERFARELPEGAPRFPVDPADAPPAVTAFEEIEAGLPIRLPESLPEPRIKLSAAWLIEHAGIARGFRLPGSGAAISSKHTLAITNRGAASAADVAELGRFVVQRVQQEFGIILAPEPNLYGLEL